MEFNLLILEGVNFIGKSSIANILESNLKNEYNTAILENPSTSNTQLKSFYKSLFFRYLTGETLPLETLIDLKYKNYKLIKEKYENLIALKEQGKNYVILTRDMLSAIVYGKLQLDTDISSTKDIIIQRYVRYYRLYKQNITKWKVNRKCILLLPYPIKSMIKEIKTNPTRELTLSEFTHLISTKYIYLHKVLLRESLNSITDIALDTPSLFEDQMSLSNIIYKAKTNKSYLKVLAYRLAYVSYLFEYLLKDSVIKTHYGDCSVVYGFVFERGQFKRKNKETLLNEIEIIIKRK